MNDMKNVFCQLLCVMLSPVPRKEEGKKKSSVLYGENPGANIALQIPRLCPCSGQWPCFENHFMEGIWVQETRRIYTVSWLLTKGNSSLMRGLWVWSQAKKGPSRRWGPCRIKQVINHAQNRSLTCSKDQASMTVIPIHKCPYRFPSQDVQRGNCWIKPINRNGQTHVLGTHETVPKVHKIMSGMCLPIFVTPIGSNPRRASHKTAGCSDLISHVSTIIIIINNN